MASSWSEEDYSNIGVGKIPFFHEGAVIGIVGPRRSGKGLLAAWFAHEFLTRGLRVFHLGNLGIGTTVSMRWLLDALSNPNRIKDSLVVLDEANLSVSSAGGGSIAGDMLQGLVAQLGHSRTTVVWLNQTATQRVQGTFGSITDLLFSINWQVRHLNKPHSGETHDEAGRRGACKHCAGIQFPWTTTGRAHILVPPYMQSCGISPLRLDIYCRLIAQPISQIGKRFEQMFGPEIEFIFRCAQRLFPANFTGHNILRENLTQKSRENLISVKLYNTVVVELAKSVLDGDAELSFVEFAGRVLRGANLPTHEVTPQMVQSILTRSIGVKLKRGVFDISEHAEQILNSGNVGKNG